MKTPGKTSRLLGLTVDYSLLGTVCIDELVQAMWEDIKVVKGTYNVRYVNGFKLYLPVSNEYGEFLQVRHPAGPLISRIHTSHYRPSCWDYHL